MSKQLVNNKYEFSKVSPDKYKRLTFVSGARTGFIYAIKPLGYYEDLNKGIKLYDRSLKIISAEKSKILNKLKGKKIEEYLNKNGKFEIKCDSYLDVDRLNDKVDKMDFAVSLGTGINFSITKELIQAYNKSYLERHIERILKVKNISRMRISKTDFILEPLMIKDIIVNDDIEDFIKLLNEQNRILKKNNVFMPKELTDLAKYTFEFKNKVTA